MGPPVQLLVGAGVAAVASILGLRPRRKKRRVRWRREPLEPSLPLLVDIVVCTPFPAPAGAYPPDSAPHEIHHT